VLSYDCDMRTASVPFTWSFSSASFTELERNVAYVEIMNCVCVRDLAESKQIFVD